MAAQVFPPDDAAGAAIHDEVGVLVDEVYLIEGCLWEDGRQGEYPYQCYAEHGEGVFLDETEGFLCHDHYNLLQKYEKFFILLSSFFFFYRIFAGEEYDRLKTYEETISTNGARHAGCMRSR